MTFERVRSLFNNDYKLNVNPPNGLFVCDWTPTRFMDITTNKWNIFHLFFFVSDFRLDLYRYRVSPINALTVNTLFTQCKHRFQSFLFRNFIKVKYEQTYKYAQYIKSIVNLMIFFSLIAFYDIFFNAFTRIRQGLQRTIDCNVSFSGYWKRSLRGNGFQLRNRTFYLDISNIFQYNWNVRFQIVIINAVI